MICEVVLLHCRDEIRIHGIYESVLRVGIVPFECCGVEIPNNNHGDFTFALIFAGRDVFGELLPEDFVRAPPWLNGSTSTMRDWRSWIQFPWVTSTFNVDIAQIFVFYQAMVRNCCGLLWQ